MPIKQIVPVLRVADVARSIEWYRGTLGFAADPFPATPPYEFAILRQGTAELMLRRGRRLLAWDDATTIGTSACGSRIPECERFSRLLRRAVS
jgi:catechol 2,3-dioxygenase-like lactoylglutathione lyase family enzyme